MKIGLEVAESEFDRWVEAMDLDLDQATMDTADLASFSKQRRRLIRAMMKGALVIREDGLAVYTPYNKNSKSNEPLIFNERTGASLMAMDSRKSGHDAARTYAILGDLCKVHPSIFANLAGEDIKVCEALFAFLMD